jgi:hypothetical protein
LKKEENQRFGFDDRIPLGNTVKPEEDLDDSFMRLAHEGIYSKSKEADV